MKLTTDYSSSIKQVADPKPASMIETFRAIGYNLETAIADIIDNSISANAENINVNFLWEGEDSIIYIKDDGLGMSEAEIIEAMRPGSKNPIDNRPANDLGRFGLGLKTASFSQCRHITLISKQKNSNIHYWTWDLDHVNSVQKWELVKIVPLEKLLMQLQEIESGTIVLWKEIDRLVLGARKDDIKDHEHFLTATDTVKKHLAMVFHRYIEKGKINLNINERKITAWDPFLKGFQGCQPIPEEGLINGQIKVKGYVLPHKSKLSESEYKNAEGTKGWNEQQGFYIYRNERLLVAGDWLGLFRKEEHYKLARIIIDIPNTLDSEWQIDIKKSIATPPYGLKTSLRLYASKVRSQAVDVYRHKGKVIQRKYATEEFHVLWTEKLRNGKRHYEINKNHPLVKAFSNENPTIKNSINTLLKFIEETVPIPLITLRESENPELHIQPFESTDHNPIRLAMKQIYDNFKTEGKTDEYAKGIILNIEPFNLYPQYIDQLC